MPVEVHVPVRLRVTPEALAEQPDRVQAALDRALARVMTRSTGEVMRRTGDYLPAHLAAPEFHWRGPALASISPAVRRETERSIAASIAALGARRAGDAEWSDASPLKQAPAEPFDPVRAMPFGRYLIDSYENGDAVNLPTDRIGGGDAGAPFIPDWDRHDVPTYDLSFVHQVFIAEAFIQKVTLASVGALLVRATGHQGWTMILSSDGFTGSQHRAVSFPPQKRRRPIGIVDGRMQYEEYELVPPLTSASITQITLPGNEAELIDRLAELMGPTIATELRDQCDPGEMMDRYVISADELEALIAQETEAEIARMAASLGGRTYMLRIDWGDIRFNVAFDHDIGAALGWAGDSPGVLLPALTMIQDPARRMIGTGGEGDGGPLVRARGGSSGGGGAGSRYGTSGDGTGEGGGIFPSLGGGSTLCCEPFLDVEPSLDELGDAANGIRRLVDEIAQRLSMRSCKYAATFCVGAAEALAGHAAAIGVTSGDVVGGEMTMPRGLHGGGGTGGGNMGQADFRPAASRGIQLLRRLAQAAGKIALLRRLIVDFYLHGEGRTRLGGRFRTEPVGWVLRFEEAVSPNMKAGVGEIFAQTCQIVMLQLLDTSAQQIAARQRNLHAYAPLFREILIRRLSDIGTLTSLRDRLRSYELARELEAAMGTPGGAAVGAALPQWAAAARALSAACVSTEGFAHMPGAANEIVTEGGVHKIRDAHGFLWSRAALEQTIAEQRGGAESIDPLIQQLSDIPGTVERFRRDPSSAEPMLADLLERMARLNAEQRTEASGDLRFGLRVGRINEDYNASLVPGLPYNLAGVHLLAHEQIFPFFDGEINAYAQGVDHIFSVELGIQGLTHFFTFTGLVLLAVVCAPAAFVAGVGTAAIEVERAEARRDLYRSLINPELVLNRTEVELECYIAYVGLALSLLPEAGTAARAISVGVRGAARRGAVAGMRIAARSVVRQASRQVTEQLAGDMLPALLREVTTNLLMEQVIVPQVIGPVIAAVEREMQVRMSVGGMAGANRLIEQIEAEAIRRSAVPLPHGLASSGGAH